MSTTSNCGFILCYREWVVNGPTHNECEVDDYLVHALNQFINDISASTRIQTTPKDIELLRKIYTYWREKSKYQKERHLSRANAKPLKKRKTPHVDPRLLVSFVVE